LYFWRVYEMDFPEGSNMKVPKDADSSFGAYPFKINIIRIYLFPKFSIEIRKEKRK
jgi:hypothetical protein